MRTVLAAVVLAIVVTCSYLYFRTWSQEQARQALLRRPREQGFSGRLQDVVPAGESLQVQSRSKCFEKDWGPATPYSHGSAAKVDNVDYCGDGVVFNVSYPNADPLVLWVERDTNIISFAPSDWERCPGRHWQFRRFFKSLFSS